MDAYSLALDQARKELVDAQSKLKALMLRVSQLESFVAQAEALMGGELKPISQDLFEASREHTAVPPSVASTVQSGDQPPIWKAIINALNGKKGDFTVPEALAALERTGRHIQSPNRLNIIRNTIIQRDKEFGRLGIGHYFVRGFQNTTAVETNEKEAPEGTS
jgi:hypothetical protein